jgi:hypothetical protein
MYAKNSNKKYIMVIFQTCIQIKSDNIGYEYLWIMSNIGG